ncbi:leukemia inhibitory factor receptor [Sarotherodon galilaeus]
MPEKLDIPSLRYIHETLILRQVLILFIWSLRSCRLAPLIQCDYCPLLFHMDCLDPPLTALPAGKWMCPNHVEHLVKSEQTNDLPEKSSSKRSASPSVELQLNPGRLQLDGLPPGAGAAGPGLRVAQVRLLDRRTSHRPSSRPGTPNSNTSSTPNPSEEQNDEEEEAAEPEDEVQGAELESSTVSAPTLRLLKRPFQLLIAAAMERNPTQFQLPSELTGTTALPGSSKRRKKEELLGKPFRRPQHELDPNGLVPLPVKICFSCNRSCRLAPLIQCDYCPLLFHMDCLDPPLTALPAGKWMCPNHVEHLVLNQRSLSLSSRCQLFDQFQDRMSQHAVKLDFLRRVHRQNAPNRRTTHQRNKKTIKVPDAIKSQYQNPPPMLLPAGVRQLELVCSGIPDHQPTKHFTTEAEQQEWLQDVIALQCSIMRHLSIKQKASSTEWDFEKQIHNQAAPALMDSLLPNTLSSITNLSSCMKDGKEEDGAVVCLCFCARIELDKLDAEMIKLLANQRIQQLFAPKVPSTQPPPTTSTTPKTSPPHPNSQKKVQARAVFYPLTGRGAAVSMCYRTLHIGSGADMDVCLTNYGHCNYISGKHACIFYDENTKHYELLNYSEHGTTVDNVLYSCHYIKKREEDEGANSVVGLLPVGGVMSSQRQGGAEPSCSCKASSSSLIGGSGAGWEGTALLHHGSYIKLGCLQFVFSITEFASKQPKEEQATTPAASCTNTNTSSSSVISTTLTTTANTSTPPPPSTATMSGFSNQDEADSETVPPHQVPVLRSNSVP